MAVSAATHNGDCATRQRHTGGSGYHDSYTELQEAGALMACAALPRRAAARRRHGLSAMAQQVDIVQMPLCVPRIGRLTQMRASSALYAGFPKCAAFFLPACWCAINQLLQSHHEV